MSPLSSPRSLWPVLVGLVALLLGALTLEAVGRSGEASATTIVITRGTASAMDSGTGDVDLRLTEPVSSAHAEARKLAQRGKLGEAARAIAAVVEEHPQSSQLLAELGYFQLQLGNHAGARRSLERARSLAPDNAWIALTAGTARRLDGDLAGAERGYRAALALQPSYSAAQVALGRLLRRTGKLAEAIAILEEAARRGSNERRATALAALGRAQLESGRTDAAERSFELAIGRAPAAVAVRLAIGRAYTAAGDARSLGRAIEVLDTAVRLAPAVPRLRSALGAAFEKRGAVAEAATAYEQALQLDAGYVYARRRLVKLLLDIGNYSAAEKQVAALLDTDRAAPEHHFLAGRVAAKQKRYDQARAHYRNATDKASGNYPEALLNLGKLEKAAGDLPAAIQSYRQALLQRPTYRAARNNLGLALAASGRLDEAVASFAELERSAPDYAAGALNQGKVLVKTKQFAEALRAFERALQLRPGFPAARLNLGVALRKAGRSEDAVAAYDALLAEQPRYVSAWYNRGIALEQAHRDSDARSSYKQALEIDGAHDASLRRLGRLESRVGHLVDAREIFTEVLDRSPADSEIRLLLADVRRRGGDLAGCARDARLVANQTPRDPEALRLTRECATR